MNLMIESRRIAVAALLGLGAVAVAQADSDRLLPRTVPRAYTQECASCHTAYPPAMLPARSWQRILGGLDRHYGTDASLDAATVQQLSGWLQANAGGYERLREEPPQDRITRSAWFVRKHREINPSVFRLASVKSAANCAACHAGADHGNFDDDHLKLPAGVDARARRQWND
jgi:hypothetical protein